MVRVRGPIELLGVDSRYRGRWFRQTIATECLRRTYAKGALDVYGDTDSHRVAVRGLYESVGPAVHRRIIIRGTVDDRPQCLSGAASTAGGCADCLDHDVGESPVGSPGDGCFGVVAFREVEEFVVPLAGGMGPLQVVAEVDVAHR
jgi:hypothetical protein